MAIQNRRGLEKEFDPNKMVPGEWAISTDTRYVRMCFAPGIVMRMATYEAFENDMVKVQQILSECESIKTAIQRIQSEVNAKAALTIEYAESAAESAKKAEESEAKAKMHSEKAEAVTDVHIATKERAGLVKGGDNHIAEDGTLILTYTTTDSTLANSHAGGIKITPYGNTEQDGTTGKNLLPNTAINETVKGITFTRNSDGSITASGTADSNCTYSIYGSSGNYIWELPAGDYILSGCKKGEEGKYFLKLRSENKNQVAVTINEENRFTHDGAPLWCYIYIYGGTQVNETFYPMVRLASVTDDTYEPYTGGQASPSPDYPQEIKSVKGKNLLENKAVSETVKGVTFTVNDDGIVILNGTATNDIYFPLNTSYYLADGYYKISVGHTKNSSCYMYIKDDNGNYYSAYETSTHISADIDNYAYIFVKSGFVANNMVFKPMIRKATIADDTYVPYGLLRFKARNKNLLNARLNVNIKSNDAYNIYDVKPNTNYTLTLCQEMVALGTNKRAQHGISCYDKDGVRLSQGVICTMDFSSIGEVLTKTQTIKTPVGTHYVRLDLGCFWGADVTSTIKTIYAQFEEGEATPYKPYTENSITLSEPIEMNGKGERDGIVEKDGLYGFNKKFGKAVFDGSNDENWYSAVNGRVYIGVTDIKKHSANVDTNNIWCKHFTQLTKSVLYDSLSGFAVESETGVLFFKSVNSTSVEEWKAWLQANPISVTYELAEPTFEPFPTADQIAMRSLMSYDGVTYVSCDSEVEPLIVTKYGTSEVGAMTIEAHNKAEKNEIKLEELTAAILMLNQE